MTYWEITPYHDRDEGDSFVCPAETDEDHHAALDYAKDRLESLWDSSDLDQTITVTMTLRSGTMLGADSE